MSEPFELTLEGLRGDALEVRFVPEGAPIADDVVEGEALFAGRLLGAFGAGRVSVKGRAAGELWVADFHLIRDLAERFGIVAAEPHPALECRNCHQPLSVDPLGVDPETLVSAPVTLAIPPERWATPVDGVAGAILRPVRVSEARGYWRALMAPPDRFGAEVARGLGLDALLLDGGERLEDPSAIAERMNGGSEALLDVLTAAYEVVQYPERMRFGLGCSACGAVHDVPTPSIREADPPLEAFDAIYGVPESAGAMLDIDAFTAATERLTAEVFAARGVANLDVVIEDGVPPVDDSGEPLMGSYQPIHERYGETFTDLRFEIALYYRTFASMFDEAPYDVEAEIRETLDHEVEHHLHHLSGHDPLDAAERAEARRELERTFGKDAVRRAERGALLTELAQMGKVFFWGLLLVAIGVGLLVAMGVIE